MKIIILGWGAGEGKGSGDPIFGKGTVEPSKGFGETGSKTKGGETKPEEAKPEEQKPEEAKPEAKPTDEAKPKDDNGGDLYEDPNPVEEPPSENSGDKTKGQSEDQLSSKGRNVPPLTPAELARVLDWQSFRNKFLKEWRGKDFSGYDAGLKSKLTKAFRSIRKNLTPDDLAATIKENRGEQILKPDGTPFDHVKENSQALKSVTNAIEELKAKMGNDPVNYAEYEQLLRNLSEVKDQVNSTVNGK